MSPSDVDMTWKEEDYLIFAVSSSYLTYFNLVILALWPTSSDSAVITLSPQEQRKTFLPLRTNRAPNKLPAFVLQRDSSKWHLYQVVKVISVPLLLEHGRQSYISFFFLSLLISPPLHFTSCSNFFVLSYSPPFLLCVSYTLYLSILLSFLTSWQYILSWPTGQVHWLSSCPPPH